YRAKAKAIIDTSRLLLEEYDGQVPRTREELVKLPGVGRKTANVVLSTAFGVPAIAVDTHVFRVANRIGLADAPDVNKTEEQLMAVIPESRWSKAHHQLIHHGRRICSSRSPKCGQCPIEPYCRYAAEQREARAAAPCAAGHVRAVPRRARRRAGPRFGAGPLFCQQFGKRDRDGQRAGGRSPRRPRRTE